MTVIFSRSCLLTWLSILLGIPGGARCRLRRNVKGEMMKRKKSIWLSFCLAVLLAPTCYAAGVDMAEGMWEITTKVEMTGMPFSMPAMTQSMCLTKEDLIPQQDLQTQNSDCTVKSKTISGNTVAWDVVCNTAEGKTTSVGKITYHGDSFEGAINMTVPGAGPMQQSMSGRRVGKCN